MKSKEVAAAIRERVNGSRKPRTAKPVNVLTKIVKAIDALPELAQRQLLAALHKRFNPSPAAVPSQAAQRQPVAQPPAVAPVHAVSRIDAPAAAQPHLSAQAPAATVPEQGRAGFFGSMLGRKAG